MNEAFPRCAVPGSSCRLLQLEAPGARPVWAVLDAAGTRHFTGEITMHGLPRVRAWFNGGELYYAEREGDAPLADRLVDLGVLTPDDLAAGSVQLGAVSHLGRLFDRVPDVDRDRVELALEILTGEVVGEIADHVVEEITVASYRHHPSGVVKWQKRPTVVISQVTTTDEPVAVAPLAPPARAATPLPMPQVDLVPTPEDEAIVAEFEASLAARVADDATPAVDDVHEHVTDALDVVSEPASVDEVVDEVVDAEEIALVGMDPSDAPTFEQPVVEPLRAPFDAPATAASEEPTSGEPTSEEPTFGEPTSGEPTLEEPTSVEPTSEDPTFVEPTLEEPALEAPTTEEPVSAVVDDAPAPSAMPAFDLSFGDLRAELEAELRAQFGTAATASSDAVPSDGVASDTVPFDSVVPDTIVPEPPTVAAATASATEVAWAIDDRIEWQVEAAAPAWRPEPPTATATPASVGGPVVEFDLQDILQQAQAEADVAAASASEPAADDDVRAAVRAALAEIEAATRTGGDHEIPSILMQAALADAEPGLPASTERWVQASLGQPDPEGRVPAPPAVAARPVLPGVTPTLPSDPAATGDDERPADPPSQEVPATGGLRRTIGFRRT